MQHTSIDCSLNSNSRMQPFEIAVEQARLDDLARRLSMIRWPNQADAPPWTLGADLAFMQQLAAHWQDGYDWRHWERRLNSVPNFKVTIEGCRLHFLVERGSGRSPPVLLLLHGWPGSIVEFLEVIEQLAHPERFGGNEQDGFTLVIPSLPGFGFSDAPRAPIGPAEIGRTFATLMHDVLGYNRYFVQGGDWGAIVASWMALERAPGLAALHLNGPGLAGGHPQPEPDGNPLTPEELAWLTQDSIRRRGHMAYQRIQGTEPQTLAYGLTDSPIGLAAWIVQRFHNWTVRGSTGSPPFSLDHLLTNIMLYWLSGINAPNWLYVSLVEGNARAVPHGQMIEVPTAFLLCPDDNTIPAPHRWLSRVFGNIRQRKITAKGGHFLAFEQPEVFVRELREYFAGFR